MVAAPKGQKLDLASDLAADQVVEIDRSDPQAHAGQLEKLAPRGFDYVIEATDSESVCQDALRFVRRGGEVLVYGVYPEDARVSWAII